MELRSKDEDFGLGLKVGSVLGFIVGLVFAHLMSSATNGDDDKTTHCSCNVSQRCE